jgi:hypothetical protein
MIIKHSIPHPQNPAAVLAASQLISSSLCHVAATLWPINQQERLLNLSAHGDPARTGITNTCGLCAG